MANNRTRLKGILKQDIEGMRNQRNSTQQSASENHPPKVKGNHGSIKFDEVNIEETLHPHNKDYGTMKINEPKTPYQVGIGSNIGLPTAVVDGSVDPDQLRSKLAQLEKDRSEKKGRNPIDAEVPETAGFKEARKQHYTEWAAVKESKQLIAEEFGEDVAGSSIKPVPKSDHKN